MRQKRFGKTGLTVPEITYGGGWVGGYIIRASEEQREAVLDKAYDAGIDWIDTAAAYGNGASEKVIGAWLKNRPVARRPRISTKFGVDVSSRESFKDQMFRSVEASLERLGLDKVELVFLHNRIVPGDNARGDARTNTLDEVLGKGGAADVMDDLKARGLCDFTGITALGDPVALRKVVDHERFDAAQVYYNLLNPTSAVPASSGWNTTDFNGLLGACEEVGMGAMGIRIFAAGHLATTVRHGRELPITDNAQDVQEEARAAAVANALGSEHGTPAQTALRFGLACPLLPTIVVGIGEAEHLDQALEAVEAGPLPEEALERLDHLRATHAAFHS
jgi:D-threo-aldose 1-dehydrogenase